MHEGSARSRRLLRCTSFLHLQSMIETLLAQDIAAIGTKIQSALRTKDPLISEWAVIADEEAALVERQNALLNLLSGAIQNVTQVGAWCIELCSDRPHECRYRNVSYTWCQIPLTTRSLKSAKSELQANSSCILIIVDYFSLSFRLYYYSAATTISPGAHKIS